MKTNYGKGKHHHFGRVFHSDVSFSGKIPEIIFVRLAGKKLAGNLWLNWKLRTDIAAGAAFVLLCSAAGRCGKSGYVCGDDQIDEEH